MNIKKLGNQEEFNPDMPIGYFADLKNFFLRILGLWVTRNDNKYKKKKFFHSKYKNKPVLYIGH